MLKEGMIVGERYEIISRIGSGGMADVYKSKDRKLNRLVAVKVMKAEFSQDRGFISKFRKEAQAAAGLAHPNVVNVYDVGEDNGIYYIVMELVQGITLKDYITRKGKLTVREATSIAIQVSLGLECAHRSNIIHRDVKPQNIIISTDGKVKLSDFGIARAASSNTISSNVMGSVHYSSPEQVRGGYSDAKSDIYSLGITMYEMVTGRVPYDGDTTVAIAIKHLQEEMESPRKYVPDLPYSLEQIILKCTQKSPDRRYASMSELIEDLKHSLLDPNGRFVTLTPLTNHAQTMMLSADELEAIREGRSGYATQQPASYNEQYQEDDDDEEEYEEEDDDDDGSEISSKLKKAMTIGGYIIGAIIICILIFVIGRAAGILKFSDKKDKENQINQEQQMDENEDTEQEEAEANNKVTVPKLLTLTEENALNVLEQMGLKGNKVSEKESSEFKAGTVMSQEIEEGTEVDPGTVINYVVSSGVNSPEVPEVLGNSQSEAEAKIKALGLETKIEQEYSDDVAIGEIISVDPKPGTIVKTGDVITLVVSLGEEDKMIEVPGVVGKEEAEAKKLLGDSGFKVQVETTKEASDNVKDGQVKTQEPAAGKEVEPGSVVVITVYHKPQETTPEPTKEEKPTATPEEKPEDKPAEEPGKWMCHVQLEQPESYTGGNVRLRLVQEVGGQQVETVLLEGQPITFPYVLNVEGAQGVEKGVVYVEELLEDGYKERGHYLDVNFKETKPKKES